MTNISNEFDIRFLHHQMRQNHIRERNKRRSTLAVAGGLILAVFAAIWMAVQ